MKASRTVKLWASVCHHLGAPSCSRKVLDQHIKDAVAGNWQVVTLGDLMNMGVSAGSKHIGLEFQDVTNPIDQIEQGVDTFMPLTKKRQIRNMIGGNHSARVDKITSIHPEKVVTMLLSIAQSGDKPKAVMPSILQRIAELGYMGQANPFRDFKETRDKLHREISALKHGAGEGWEIPFSAGLASVNIDGLTVAMHHGVCGRSSDNWRRLWNAIPGHRLYLTGHNHKLGAEWGATLLSAKECKTDWFSAGCYQRYESYASIAAYGRTRVGSLLLVWNKDTDRIAVEVLE